MRSDNKPATDSDGKEPMISATVADSIDASSVLHYARSETTKPISTFASNVRLLAIIDLSIIAISALDAGFRVPGEYYPLGDTRCDGVGFIAVVFGLPIGLLCLFVRALHIKLLALLIVVEIGVWVLCVVKNMLYL